MFVKLDNIFAPDAHGGPKSSEVSGSSKPTLRRERMEILPQAGENVQIESVLFPVAGFKKGPLSRCRAAVGLFSKVSLMPHACATGSTSRQEDWA